MTFLKNRKFYQKVLGLPVLVMFMLILLVTPCINAAIPELWRDQSSYFLPETTLYPSQSSSAILAQGYNNISDNTLPSRGTVPYSENWQQAQVPSEYTNSYTSRYNDRNSQAIPSNQFEQNNYYKSTYGSGVYLAMGERQLFRRQQAKMLEPRYPTYDHWSDISDQPWVVQILPEGLIYQSYLAGLKEPRLGTVMVHDKNFGWVWDTTLGGRFGVARFGTRNSLLPEGLQLDAEGAVNLRLDTEHNMDMMANDFRAGVGLTGGTKTWQFRFGYYHLSSHMGDEYTLRTGEPRINYARDCFILGVSRRFWQDWRTYAEVGWAFYTGEGARPWEFQFGIEYSPIYPACGFRGTPFIALNVHLFQDLDYSGHFCAQTGWQWRGKSNHLFRIGLEYVNGHDDLFEYHNRTTNKLGAGFWYDF